MSSRIDVCFVLDAVLAGDCKKLKKACKWACEKDTADREEVIEVLLSLLGAAQGTVFYAAKRQITMWDVDVITVITPYLSKLLPANRITRTFCTQDVLLVFYFGIETDGERNALVALAKWCSVHEEKPFWNMWHRNWNEVLTKPLVSGKGRERKVDARRLPDGSVHCTWGESDDEGAKLLNCKLRLKKFVFYLEENFASKEDIDNCKVGDKISSLLAELETCTAGSVEDMAQVSCLLRRAWVAVNCRWSCARETWIAAVVRSTIKTNYK